MKNKLAIGVAMAVFAASVAVVQAGRTTPSARSDVARFTPKGELVFPAHYRHWTYVTSGHGMSYDPKAVDTAGAPFDNIFVNPGADAAFRRTGHWPEGTILVLEVRGSASKGSINRHGAFQAGEPLVVEVHVRDRRFRGGWGFFAFRRTASAKLIGYDADCYSCHLAHGAVDTTFVQFYPVQLPVAQAKRTLSATYLVDEKR